MERNAEILANFEDALEIHKEKGDPIHFYIPIDDAKIIANALRVRACEYAETVEGMLSSDYKERFKAEYQQTKIRYEKLKAFNNRIEAAFATDYRKNSVEKPTFDCPQDMLRNQQRIMGEYLHILEVRAVIEGIDL